MSEASGRAEMERRLIQRSMEDEDFRRRLLSEPEATIERELGVRLTEEVRVVAVEETKDTIYLVLPPSATAGAEEAFGSGLSDRELEAVAGGGGDTSQWMCTYTCPPPAGATCQSCGADCTG
jgi:hypothetical protein